MKKISFCKILAVGLLCFVLVFPGVQSLSINVEADHAINDIDIIYPHSNMFSYFPDNVLTSQCNTQVPLPILTNEYLDEFQWPQQGFNDQHIGRSPYSTITNPGVEKWRFPTSDWYFGSPVVSSDGTIYFGGGFYLNAVNPNGTRKWEYHCDGPLIDFGSSPAITDDGTVYIATVYTLYHSKIQAIFPSGVRKWDYETPEIETSITLDDSGMLYYGHLEGVDARYPNGSLKWTFHTGGNTVQSTPAIDNDGIIYFGSHDFNIYAVYPNGTMKWNYTTDAWVHGSPSVGSDGTIYCGSDDYYLYAFYPDGSLKWKTFIGSGMRSSPSQDEEGNLYFGVWHSKIMSVAPNGTVRWEFPLRDRDRVWGSTAAISDDGTMYIGNCIDMDMNGGGEILALDLNGSLKWRKILCDSSLHSSPAISADGTVYICSSTDGFPDAWGYLHAFGEGEPRMIELRTPKSGTWYLFNKEMGSTPRGRIVIIGGMTVKVNVSCAEDLEDLSFYIGNYYQYSVQQPPFEWKMNKHLGLPFENLALFVIARYNNGCMWALGVDFWYLHLRKNS